MLSKRDKHRGLGREEIVGSSQFVAPIETELQNLQETKGGECGDLKYEGDLFYYEYGNGLYMSHDEDDNRTEVELVKDRGGDGLDTEKAYREIQMQVDDQLSDYEPQSDYESFKSSYDESERNFYNLKDDPRLEEMEPRLCIGMKSASAHQFRKCLTHYAVNNSFDLKYICNERKRVTAKCVGPNCKWCIHASRLQDDITFIIKIYSSEHSCLGTNREGNHTASAKWVADMCESMVQNDQNIKVKAIMTNIYEEYGVTLPYMHVWRGKEIALN
ncbi:hypothetical protein AAC387_Pa07g0092 [Persea americana]